MHVRLPGVWGVGSWTSGGKGWQATGPVLRGNTKDTTYLLLDLVLFWKKKKRKKIGQKKNLNTEKRYTVKVCFPIPYSFLYSLLQQ